MKTKNWFVLLALPFTLYGHFGENGNSTGRPPNILLINIDDLGWRDLGFMGSQFFESPNIDALSKKGTVFTQGYAAAANCAPSRACLMTGLWPQRHGIFTVGTSERGRSKDRRLIPVANTVTLPDRFSTLPEILGKNGYATCHAGKWHLTDSPLDNGFDVNIGGSHAGHPRSYYPPYKNVALEAEEGKRLTDRITDGAIAFIRSAKKPFFINYAPYAVHTPIQPVPGLLDKYANKAPSNGQHNAKYATMVENMDYNVGRLLGALKETGALGNTFIVFTSDNGGLFVISDQHPLRAGKGSYYEGGIRVPFFFVWEDRVLAGNSVDVPISNLDVYPTLLEAAGIWPPDGKTGDGRNLLPLLTKGKRPKKRPLYWHFPIYLEASKGSRGEHRDPLFRTRPGSVVRYGPWKLHHYMEDDALELYHLDKDRGEKNDLALTKPKKAKKMYRMLVDWQRDTNAPLATRPNPEYRPR